MTTRAVIPVDTLIEWQQKSNREENDFVFAINLIQELISQGFLTNPEPGCDMVDVRRLGASYIFDKECPEPLSLLVKPGDIIQVRPSGDVDIEPIDECWIFVLMVVVKVKRWGVQAIALAPEAGMADQPAGVFPMNLAFNQFIRIGPCPIVREDMARIAWPEMFEGENDDEED